MPTTVTGEGAPFQPVVLLWISPAEDIVLGSTAAHPDGLPGLAAEHLRKTIERSAMGLPGRAPARLRVATNALADALRAGFPDLEISVAPTPEIDTVGASLSAFIEDGPPDPGWLGDGLSADSVAGFFDAMAQLWRAAPWQTVPDDDSLFRITVEALGVHDAVAVVIGQLGESFGILLFDSVADHDRFAELGDAVQHGDLRRMQELDADAGMPAHVGLSFDPVDETAPVRLEEREAHRWALADEDAFPSLLCVEPDLQARAPTAAQLTLAEALARAFVQVAGDGAFRAAWSDGEAVERTLPVATRAGRFDVRLSAPVDGAEIVPTRDPDAIPERVYRLKIDLERCNWQAPGSEVSRTVDVAGDTTLWDLHDVVHQAFDWYDDHLFDFFVSGKVGDRDSRYTGNPMGDVERGGWGDEDEDERSVTATTLDELGLKRRRVMRYVLDGHIVHRIAVSTIRKGTPEDTGLPRPVAATGEAPLQYPPP